MTNIDRLLFPEHRNKVNHISIPGSCGDCIHSIHLLHNYFVRINCIDRVKLYFPYEYQPIFYNNWLKETKIPYEIGTLKQYNPILTWNCYGTRSIKHQYRNKSNLSISKRLNNSDNEYTSFRCLYKNDFKDICALFLEKTKLKPYDVCKVENLGEPVGYEKLEFKNDEHMYEIMNNTYVSITEMTMLHNCSCSFQVPVFTILREDNKYAFSGGSIEMWNPCSRYIIIHSKNPSLAEVVKHNKAKIMETIDEMSTSQIRDINEHAEIKNSPTISCSQNAIKLIEYLKTDGLFPDLDLNIFGNKQYDSLILTEQKNLISMFKEIYAYLDNYTHIKLLMNRGFDKINIGLSRVGNGTKHYNWNQFYQKENYNYNVTIVDF